MSPVAGVERATWGLPEWNVTVCGADGKRAETVGPDAADEDLVRDALGGNREAFDALVVRHRRAVYQLCYRYTGRHEEASDLAQDVFLRAYRGLRTFKGRSSFSTWLYRIGVNVSLSHVTGKGLRLDEMMPLQQAPVPVAAAENPSEALLREERARRVRAAIARLPPRQRATLILRVYQELSHEEIAAVLGTSVGACKGNLFHALRKLRAWLGP